MSSIGVPMHVYFLQRLIPAIDFNHRVGSFHSTVFHGIANREREDEFYADQQQLKGRYPLVLARSGRFIPPMFSPEFGALVFSLSAYDKVRRFPETRFVQAKVATLHDFSMPPLGDLSWYSRTKLYQQPDPEEEMLQSSHLAIGDIENKEFHELVYPCVDRHISELNDVIEVSPNFGSFHPNSEDFPCLVSPAFIASHPIYSSESLVVREDLFTVLAPFIDMDYYLVARMSF